MLRAQRDVGEGCGLQPACIGLFNTHTHKKKKVHGGKIKLFPKSSAKILLDPGRETFFHAKEGGKLASVVMFVDRFVRYVFLLYVLK